jgi:hypothetical protein
MATRLRIGLLLTACLAVACCRFFPESYFDLADDSRLPKWFALPEGLSRSDVKVQLYYYTGREVEVSLLTRNGRTIQRVSGLLSGHRPLTLHPSDDPYTDPAFEFITINGVSELIEHPGRCSIFRINDDPKIWAALGHSRPG